MEVWRRRTRFIFHSIYLFQAHNNGKYVETSKLIFMEIFLSITMTRYLNRTRHWNFSFMMITTQWRFMKIRLSILSAKQNQYLSKFFPSITVCDIFVFIEFFRQTDNYCFAFIEIRSKLSSKTLCTLEEQRERERKKLEEE